MWKKLFIGSVVTWVLSLGAVGYIFVRGSAEKDDDGRMAVKLQKAERNLVLGEMRALLSGVQSILEALTLNDMKIVEKSSRSLGMQAAVDVNPRLMAKLPLEFKSTGMEVHKRFDDLADKVHSGSGKDEVLKEVSDIMLSCVGCHQAFRLDEVP
jgi:methyl coenzyme M reductase subunit C-like uncharacterized protein (methanogenesis marker protein 7)